jgi:hypothetical protein
VSPSISSVFTQEGVAWEWTEADDEAVDDELPATWKPCFRIPCGTFDEERLVGHGICITTGNLSEIAWAEQNARYIDLATATHAHVQNARRIARMVAESNAVTMGALVGAGLTGPVLGAIELQVLDYRDKFRMDPMAVLEAVFPSWVYGAIRFDLSLRNGVNYFQVSDQEIRGWFTLRGVRPQFVQDWQPLQLSGGDGFREAYPTTLNFLLYAAGTFVLGRGGSIDLGVVRDSTLNAQNDHIAMWSEEFDLVAKRGHESRNVAVTLPAEALYGGDALVRETAVNA